MPSLQQLPTTPTAQTKIGHAPGHKFIATTQTGIEWQPGLARLWRRDGSIRGESQMVAEAACKSQTAWDFWYNLEFAEVFPQVQYWWFGSGWTQKVRLTGPTGMLDDETVTGLMQFVDDEMPGTMWTMANDNPQVTISTPLPPFETGALNLPLRLELAELVLAVIYGDIAANEWQLVTSLVHRDKLAERLPLQPLPWRLEVGVEARQSIREAFCYLQGLRPPADLR
ncbi:MAG TPA: hypothetical protein VH186_15800 [Chloroflexia bacterium]|nr:hypothetical protein [Chloroflexia bacterium]